ncbi:MAG: IS66 family transposase [Planctomycetota bacterium]
MTPREAELTRQLEAALAAVATLQAENTLLRQKVDRLVRRVFGSSSEQLSTGQLELLLALPATPPVVPSEPPLPTPAPVRPRKERTPRLPENLPVVEEVLEPAAVQAAPAEWRRIGEEISEQLDYEPGRFLRRRLVRPKYVRKDDRDAAPVIAPLPARLQDRSLPAPGLLAQVLVGKYCDHLPLYRQERIFATRHRVNLPRQTLARWVELAADWLRPVYQQIKTGVLAGGYVQVDETPIAYLDPGGGRTGQGYLWVCAVPRGDVVFHWETSRAAECLAHVVPVDFTGTVQCDGYAAYPAFARQHPRPLILAGCWAHVRRKFHDAREQSPKLSGWFLRQFQHLYQIEAQLRAKQAGPALRAALRASHSRMVVERLQRALLRVQPRALPQSLLGQAISYALGQWPTLTVYLDDGRVELDNNLVENAIRPTALGKKNWLFVGDAGAGQRGAILYTVIESCRRRGLDPYAYLKDVLTRLPSMTNHQVAEITPAVWGKNGPPHQRIAS